MTLEERPMNNEVTRKLQEQDFWDESKRKVIVNCSFRSSENPELSNLETNQEKIIKQVKCKGIW